VCAGDEVTLKVEGVVDGGRLQIWFSGTDGYAAQNLTSMWGHLGVGFGPASGFSICEFKEVRGCTSVGALRGI
jgi:hypothetical protein